MPTARASAPGKVILFGEHAVVHGVTAIAAALSDLRIFVDVVSVDDAFIEVILHDIISDVGEPFSHKISLGKCLSYDIISQEGHLHPISPSESTLELLRMEFSGHQLPAMQGLMAVVYLVPKILPEFFSESFSDEIIRGLKISVKSERLPIGAGLGSSAAFSVALAGALMRYRQLVFGETVIPALAVSELQTDDHFSPSQELLNVVNGWAYAAEVVIHGSPSGLDNTTSCFGGAVKFNKGSSLFEKLSPLPSIQIVLTNTKVPRSTKVLVAGVKKLYDSDPAIIKPILDSIESISQKFLSLLDSSRAEAIPTDTAQFEEELGSLVRINHYLLCALGVGHPSLTAVIEEAAKRGWAAKLTGAGGGGCAFTIVRCRDSDCTENGADQGKHITHYIDNVLNDMATSSFLLSHGPCARITFEVDEYCQKLSVLGFESFQSSIGGDGLRWYRS